MRRKNVIKSMSLPLDETLPDGWAAVPLGEIATLINGYVFTPKQWTDDGLPIVRIQNLNDPDASFNRCDLSLPARFKITTGEVLFAWSGTPDTSFGAHIWAGGDAWLNQHIYKITFDRDLIDARYLQHAINSNLAYYISQAKGGSGLAHLNKGQLLSSLIALAPQKQQIAIANKVDDFIGEIEQGTDSLKEALLRIENMRSLVLRSAAFGHGKPHPSSGLGASEGRGGIPDLEALPSTWRWSTVGDVGEVVVGRQRAPKHHGGPHMRPYLRVANVFEDRIDTRDILQMNFTPEEFAKYRLVEGDILLNEGQSVELVGRAAMYGGEVPGACFQNTLLRFRASATLDPRFALLVFRAYLRSGRFQRIAKRTTNIAHISRTRFVAMDFPFPPMSEQRKIVRGTSDQLSKLASAESVIRRGLERARSLRRQLMKYALAGRLVAAEGVDVQPEQLLEQIRRRRNTIDSQPEPNPQSFVSSPGKDVSLMESRSPLLDLLRARPEGLSPEELFQQSGYAITEVELYYKELQSIESCISEERASRKAMMSWPYVSNVLLRVND